MQTYATATAISREISYPELHLKGRWVSWLSPPPLGKVLVIFSYWAVIMYLLLNGAVVDDAYYWERIGFRGAWVSVTQVPLVYLLASKSSLIGFLIGISYERLNWLHRWVSRTLLVTVTVHGAFFMAEWVRADFVEIEIWMMPMVMYGLGAWAVLVWTFFTSLSPLRRIAYEFFVLQHIVSAGVFLWLLWVHVPSYAMYNIWFAIAAISFDWVLRLCLLFYQNIRLRPFRPLGNGMRRIGHPAKVQAMSSDITILTIKDAHISWKPGQHIHIWLPRLGLLESHPFTIASRYTTSKECDCNDIQLAIRAQSGFSKRIHRYAKRTQDHQDFPLTAFIAGPYGSPPRWDAFETLLLISASTGASFTLPILESLLHNQAICTKRISFLLVVHHRRHIDFYERRLSDALNRADAQGISLTVEIAMTRDRDQPQQVESSIHGQDGEDDEKSDINTENIQEKDHDSYMIASRNSNSASSSNASSAQDIDIDHLKDRYQATKVMYEPEGRSQNILYSYRRPDIAAFIRGPIEATGGETSLAVCGGKSLVSTVRNAVASLSDERAVHKGTGAQGIHLHVEEYSF
jgi:ferredoxin-NADP reductase